MRPKFFGYNVISFVILGFTWAVVFILGNTAAQGPEQALQRNLIFFIGLPVGFIISYTARVANQWEKAVILRLGRFTDLKGPGLFWIIPLIDRVVMWIDQRIRATGFAAEKTLTHDTVPVNVDAVLFWQVNDAEKAALNVENYNDAVAWAAQTALRDVIGKTMLAGMLTGREAIDEQLRIIIDERTHDWGISVRSVEIRDVVIPADLEDAMSRKAQAEREKQARVILGDAEVEIAEKFETASKRYEKNPTAFHLRAMNILYEGMKEKGSLMVVPSAVSDALNLGTYAGLAAMDKTTQRDGGKDKEESE
jgi:regulator of protease activity HflC (stomatin/prohibitin superfamily)